MPFTRVASLTEIPPGEAKQVTVNGKLLGLYNVEGTIYALDDVCTHRGAPLSEGFLVGSEVECPWHGARFNVTTGTHLCPPAPRAVACYKVQIVGDEVQVDV